MATFDDAKEGWEIFRAANFGLKRGEINSRLAGRGKDPISERTYNHYKKLRRYGFRSYVPINQLDVKTLEDPLWDQAVRNRYPVYTESVPVEFEVTYMGKENLIKGYTVEFSQSYVTCRIKDPAAVELLANSSFRRQLKATRVLARLGSGELYPARVEQVKAKLKETVATVVMGFTALAAVENVTDRTLLPTTELRIRIEPSGAAVMLAEVVRKLYWVFQTFDTSKVICEEYLIDFGMEERYTLPPTELKQLSKRSSLEATLVVGLPAAYLVLAIARELLAATTDYPEGGSRRAAARWQKLQSDILERSSARTKQRLVRLLSDNSLGGSEGNQIKFPSERWRELAENQLLPSIRELLDSDTGKVTFESEDLDSEGKGMGTLPF